MDCNGCVQKIKRALHGINGIYDLYIDLPQQKLTIIGWADPEKILKAIRKTRKTATICSHTEPEPATPPTEQPLNGDAEPLPAPEGTNSPAADAPPAAEPPQPENPPPDAAQAPPPSPIANDTNAAQPTQPTGPNDVGEAHVIYRLPPPDYGYRYGYSHGYVRPWNKYPSGQGLPPESSQPLYVTHSYNTYKPSPYVTEYEYIRSPPRYTYYSRRDHYNEDYHRSSSNGNITSMFSDENPNACTIV
ncbi:heavy metal-associated isoprenylated plant protein 35-like isoform X2 [Tripterygium wilfordii]|nr:heavy metal-associated isoprenylated plant protein 35-like isoform X2 [Tripterygium wilfordii]XP_038721339.1 heavy metal-associated isoprenylated plant protein 35-like isoform X2 [Tripterygium wilfordii]